MKRVICILIASSILSTIAYAGQWQQDETGWRYQNDDGSYKTGWFQDENGSWYYFDDQSTYMLTDVVTPDGYTISDDGTWHEGSNSNSEETYGYDNKVNLEVTVYTYPGGTRTLDYTLPVYVYYNNSYLKEILVSRIALSDDDGELYIAFTGELVNTCALDIKYRYYFTDGTYLDDEDLMFIKTDEREIVKYIRLAPRELRKSPVSVDIWIEEAEDLNE